MNANSTNASSTNDRNVRVSRYVLLAALMLAALQVPAFESLACRPLLLNPEPPQYSVVNSDSLLWRIHAPGRAPSWLFGTMHLGDEEITRLPAKVAAAFDQSDSLITEVNPDEIDPAAIAGHYFYTDAELLQKALPAALFSRLLELMRPYGIPLPLLARMRPHAAYLTLSGPPPGAPPPLDQVLSERARQAGKQRFGLETVGEQLQAFAVLSDLEQVEILEEVICHQEHFQADRAQLRQIYLDGDVAALVRFSEKYQDRDEKLNQRLMQALVETRNVRMAERLLPLLQTGSVFVAVGALHLPGEEGLVALLRAAGLRLQPVTIE